MLFYANIKTYPAVFRSFTGLDVPEFESLLAYFEKAWDELREEAADANKDRQRRGGGGAVPTTLRTHEDRLFFILVYLKLYPLQVVMGFLFGMSQGRANEWISRLGTVLQKALGMAGALPARDPVSAKRQFEASTVREFIIDGTERKTQRPSENERQKTYYSGKKKAHTLKNDLVVDTGSYTVAYLSPTVPGKTHDKVLADQCALEFPPNSVLFQDTGFQGYAPSGAIVMQPKKKPRGKELTVAEKIINRVISKTRVIVEHVIAGVKRSRIVKDVFRNTRKGYDDTVMELACGLHNRRCRHRRA
ncbi:transposase family protein [Methylovulum psychrotolerans]|uniref:transposase family protein n=1 Tax=Methylovulum psychrotolerans TaxID=1704499 RepID=UPI001BFF428D|nr:transposase family protein [Methylovulum psychrotolerans]MBT9097071.1 transposase family protein [Methylovulum psychrotolerans]MBT9097531.1 transposase family protein [Methylovulum psychrotolerans]MBT9098195.1 transposase family protein [Methylovulum psychrotolerans]MBT9099395.1 transposase family protein [Methylovulum psychrotolerans]MBT9100260.1 transposase family protein [Methylovulum psychrotolerans]